MKSSLILLVSILAVYINAIPLKEDHSHERIIGGERASIGQFPYQVALRVQDRPGARFRHDCGGSILNEHWVLTAAHCTVTFNIYTLIVVVGAHRITDGTPHKLELIVNHPKYVRQLTQNDVALLKTIEGIKYNRYVQPIPISRQHVYGGLEAVTSGWGLTENRRLPDYLLYIRTQTLTNEECKYRLDQSVRGRIFDTSLCVVKRLGVSVCTGDSGGPLVINNILVGITSWGSGGCQGGVPDVFARVSQFADWIAYYSGVTPLN